MKYLLAILLIAALFIAGCGEKEVEIVENKTSEPVVEKEPEPVIVETCPISVDISGKTTVCQDGTCDYRSIEAAIKAKATDIVVTDCETYKEHLIINEADITVDCQNAVLDGNGQQTGFDLKSGSENIVIKNCQITNYIYGVSMLGTINSKVLDNEFKNTNAGIRLKLGKGDEIKDNLFVSNGQGILIESSSDAKITGNTVRDSELNGIQISGASKDCVIDGNKVIGSGQSGIKNLARGNTISNNEAIDNLKYGIECQLSEDVELSNNVCTGNEAGECAECEAASCTYTGC